MVILSLALRLVLKANEQVASMKKLSKHEKIMKIDFTILISCKPEKCLQRALY